MHWESPVVVNGRVYVTDESGQLWAYALDGIFKDGFE
ncbi:MAG: PQQ-binding-like beta-propeller repeat protein [Deltaproteobacteria bacterium]